MEGETYEFRVVAFNKAGDGKPSQSTAPIKIKDPFGRILDKIINGEKKKWALF